jgi:hypothetical protein
LLAEAANYYKAIYGDAELRNELCLVRTNAWQYGHAEYGNTLNTRLPSLQ